MDAVFRPLHLNLVHELEKAGFRAELGADSPTFVGDISDQTRTWRVIITMDGGYPTRPPRACLADTTAPQCWHQNRDGSMCLYTNAVRGVFPWLAPNNLIDRVRDWCVHRADGWPDDQPDLDLHRYWPPSSQYRLLIHSPLQEGCRGFRRLALHPQTTSLRECGAQAPPGHRGKSHRFRYAVVRDIGELSHPVTEWSQLRELITEPDEVETILRNDRAQVVLVRYTRSGHAGVLALHARPAKNALSFCAIEAAEDSPETINLRRGPHLAELMGKKVAIVGVGAVGSYLALNLHRAGLGRLTLSDYELLRPGNTARHAAERSFVGWNKADAMKRILQSPDQCVQSIPRIVSDIDQARQLVAQHDLVADATSDDTVANLLAIAAAEAGTHIVSTYLENQGRTKVVEVITGPKSGWAQTSSMDPIGVEGFEAGCGDPVSPTPLYEVQALAAMASRTVIELLVGKARVVTQVCETP